MKTTSTLNQIGFWMTKAIAMDDCNSPSKHTHTLQKKHSINQRITQFSLIQVLLLISILLIQVPFKANADSNAYTDDRSTAVPTAWWLYTGASASTIGSLINTNAARLTDIELYSVVNGVPYFTVRMVKNSGTYAVPGWWWYYGLTSAQVSTYLTQNNGRLIDLEPYDAGGGNIRYAVIMVSNTGTAARTWWWQTGVSSGTLSALISSNNARIIDLDSYFIGATQYYSAVFVSNTGSDAKAWQWWLNQTAADVSAKLSAFGGRLVDIERLPSGNYNVVMVKNSRTDTFSWWWKLGFASATDVLNYANQLATRPVDIETYLDTNGARRYSAIFIDNANTAATRRIRSIFTQSFMDSSGNLRGIFEAYLKQAGSSVLVDLNSSRRAETASSLKSLHLLHAMRSVQAGENLTSSFTYYNYPSSSANPASNACPKPADEVFANMKTDYNLGKGLTEMMRISDNRTTRGVVLRYGGFTPINSTASSVAGMVGTQLRHNIGCAYWNFSTSRYDTSLRNDTTAADLARIYEGVWNSVSLTGTARTGYLNFANPGSGVSASLQTIINEEATAQGKLAIASTFGSLVRSWGKGGSYGTCLPNSVGGCGQTVMIRSGTGIIRFPIKVLGVVNYRTYVFGRLISDVPTVSFTSPDITAYEATYAKASNELYREVIRSALLTW